MAAVSLVRADLEHADSGSSSSVSEEEVQTSWPIRRVGKVVLATGCLVACVAGAAVWGGGYFRKSPARSLFESPELADIMTKNLIKEGIAHSGDEAALHEVAMRKLTDVAANLDNKDLEQGALKLLDSLKLTKEQKDHIMQKVSSLSDPRLQKFGKEVSKIVLENKGKKPDVVLAALKDKFASKMPELRKLQKELLPNAGSLMKHMNQTNLFKEMIKPQEKEERRLAYGMTTTPVVSTGGMITDEDESKAQTVMMDTVEVVTGLVEQTRVVLDQVDFLGEAFNADWSISPYVKSAVGLTDFVAEVGECMMRAGSNTVKMSVCPMKFASAGADAVECIDNLMGMDNSKFGMNGESAKPTPGEVTAAPAAAWGGPAAPAGPTAPVAGGWER